jgi:hypothetical protein
MNPQLVGCFGMPGPGEFFDVTVNTYGTRTYCADVNNGIAAFDTTNKANPIQISTSSDATGFGAGKARLDRNRNILFATDFQNMALKAFDTQTNPPLSLIGSTTTPTPNQLVYLSLDQSNNIAFVAEFGGTKDTIIKMIDVSNPANMQEIDETRINPISSTASIQAIQTYNNKLYVSHAEGNNNQTAFLSIIPYAQKGFAPPLPVFSGNVPGYSKVQIAATGDGPIDGLAINDDILYLPLLNSDFLRRDGTVDQDRGNLVIAQLINIPTLQST